MNGVALPRLYSFSFSPYRPRKVLSRNHASRLDADSSCLSSFGLGSRWTNSKNVAVGLPPGVIHSPLNTWIRSSWESFRIGVMKLTPRARQNLWNPTRSGVRSAMCCQWHPPPRFLSMVRTCEPWPLGSVGWTTATTVWLGTFPPFSSPMREAKVIDCGACPFQLERFS